MRHTLLTYEERINKVLEYIEQNLDQSITLDLLAEASYFSLYHFHRIFNALVGETPMEYLRRIRLERSAFLLVNNKSVSITDIALQCGFSSSAVFSRAFQNHFQTSPRTYRKKAPGNCRILRENNQSQILLKSAQNMGHVKLELFPAYTVIIARHQSGYNKGISIVWKRLMCWAFAHDLIGQDYQTFGIPLDNPEITPSGKCRYYACLVVNHTFKDTLKLPGYLSFMEIPAGIYARYHFEGGAENISNAYYDLYGNWLPTSGFEPTDSPALEIYSRNNKERSQGKFNFDICLPITSI